MKRLFPAIMATTLIATAHAGDEKDMSGMGIDILAISLVKDVQDHVLYIQLSRGAPLELTQLLKDNLASKLFDLGNYAPQLTNPQAVGLMCRSTSKLIDDINEITNGCKNPNGERICEEYSRLSVFCVKHE